MRSGSSLVAMSTDRLRKIFDEGKPDWLARSRQTKVGQLSLRVHVASASARRACVTRERERRLSNENCRECALQLGKRERQQSLVQLALT